MSLPSFATQDLTVWRAPTILDHGTLVRDWTSATSHIVPGTSIQPAGGTVDNINRLSVEHLYNVYTEITADVDQYDHFEINGLMYENLTAMRRYETGILDHIELSLKAVEG